MPLLLVTTACGTREEAERLGRTLVAERLAACAQIGGPITSHYWWEGRLEQATEWVCQLKTDAAVYDRLEPRLRALHSYDVPEVTAVPVERGFTGYFNWVQDIVAGTQR